MILLFALAIFFSATLLFMVQPLAGKILLPVLGGSPAVWSTCIVFFQAMLLLGYVYAHALSTRVARRWQLPVHVCVLIVASVMLPVPIGIGEPGGADPRWWVLRALAGTVGMPFFALSATSPLLQQWFSQTNDPRAGDPYFLYSASNAGSLLDGRLGLRAVPAASYDLIVIDAFSSDAIPTHLITRESVAMYESRLKAHGMIAFHVSSRFFDLPPVVARIAADRRLAGYVRHDNDVSPEKAAQAKRPSIWVVLARDENVFGQIARSSPRWVRLVPDAGDPLWTDDYTNVLGALNE